MSEAAPGPAPVWAELAPLIELIPDGALLVDGQGVIVGTNAALQALCGRGRDELAGAPVELLLPPLQRQRHRQHLRRFFAQPHGRAMGRVPKLSLWHAQGRPVPVDISLGTLQRNGAALALAVVHDLTEIQAMHERMRHLAMHDELTGLYSRTLFGELLARFEARLVRVNAALAREARRAEAEKARTHPRGKPPVAARGAAKPRASKPAIARKGAPGNYMSGEALAAKQRTTVKSPRTRAIQAHVRARGRRAQARRDSR